MKERSPYEDFELEGAVVKRERTEGQASGRVTVIGSVDGKPHRVLVELSDPHYQIAATAHLSEQPFHCVGTMVRLGRGYVLRKPRDVTTDAEYAQTSYNFSISK